MLLKYGYTFKVVAKFFATTLNNKVFLIVKYNVYQEFGYYECVLYDFLPL